MNTAGQTARPSPAYSNAQHAAMSRNASPQSGGDIGGPKAFLAGKGIPTSGGSSKSHFLTDRTHDQGSKRLYLGKAFENAQHVKFTPVKGNSEGRAEIMAKTESSAVKKAAQSRLAAHSSEVTSDRHRLVEANTKQNYAGIPFRKSSPAFGPFGKKAPVHEYESSRRF